MSDLLNNQQDLQISLSIPEYYSAAFVQNPSTALDQAVDFLTCEQVPFRLYFNWIEPKPLPIISHAIRHMKHQRVWLVVAVVLSKSEVLDLHETLLACLVEGLLPQSAVIHKDLIQLVVDVSVITWDRLFWANIPRNYVLIYFLNLYWSGDKFITPHAYLLRETCRCDDGKTFVNLRNYMTKLAKPFGLEKLLEVLRQTKKNLRGRMIRMHPHRRVRGSWEDKWSHTYRHLSLRTAYSNLDSAFAGLLHSFVIVHNLTIDINDDIHQNQSNAKNEISMATICC